MLITFYFIQKKNQILKNIDLIEKKYNSFIHLLNRDQYFSERELNNLMSENKSLFSAIKDYIIFKNKVDQWVEKTGFLKPGIDRYVEHFSLDRKMDSIIRNINNVNEKGSDIIRNRNENYIKNELVNYSGFFDTLQENILEDEKRAIIIDEAHNLVISGAGSGKNAYLLGKIAYLLEKGLAKPDEILLIAFNETSKEELENKIRDIMGEFIQVNTFYELSLEVLKNCTDSTVKVSDLSLDYLKLLNQIEKFVIERAKKIDFMNKLNRYFIYYLNTIENSSRFLSEKEYQKYLSEIEIKTIQGEKVKSQAELEIANFLFLNNVIYDYEKKYIYDLKNEENHIYKPDFHLPDHNIWIEHFEIEENNESSLGEEEKKYREEIEWKRKTHLENYTELVETYEFERKNEILLEKLTEKLEVRGVKLQKISEDKIYSKIIELGGFVEFIELLTKFLVLYKSSLLTIQEIKEKIVGSIYQLKYYAFLDIFQLIFEDYTSYLEIKQELELNEMMDLAAQNLKERKFDSQFKYILVEEFQDISQSKFRLLKSFLDQNPESKLYCIGDDWKSIFRLNASDLTIMTNFDEYFYPNEKIFLEKISNVNENISRLAAEFIRKNPNQYNTKNFEKREHKNGVTIFWSNDVQDALKKTVEQIKNGEKKASIFVIGRYNEKYYRDLDFDVIKVETYLEEPRLQLEYLTIHKSIFREADYVIIIGLRSGVLGFPSEIADDPILNLVLEKSENYPNPEERRLLYMAMTRAKKHLYLIADNRKISPFALEINNCDFNYQVLGNPP
jgi:DNA helicase-4